MSHLKVINIYHRPVPEQISTGQAKRLNKPFRIIDITAVLTKDEIGQLAVYLGIGDVDFIAKFGTKLCYTEALHYYPMLEEADYRH